MGVPCGRDLQLSRSSAICSFGLIPVTDRLPGAMSSSRLRVAISRCSFHLSKTDAFAGTRHARASTSAIKVWLLSPETMW